MPSRRPSGGNRPGLVGSRPAYQACEKQRHRPRLVQGQRQRPRPRQWQRQRLRPRQGPRQQPRPRTPRLRQRPRLREESQVQEGARRATSRRRVQTTTVAEELVQYSVALLKVELKAKVLLVGGLRDDLVRRLRPATASDEMFRVAWRISEARNAAIPLEALRSDEELRRWIEHGLERWQRAM